MFLQTPIEIKALDDAGRFEGYGAIFGNRDFDGDIIEPGAFVEVLTTKDGKLRIAYMHDLGKIIAKADFRQDSKGLYIAGQINLAVSYARDAYQLMLDGSMDGFSVGFDILPGGEEYKTAGDTTTRHITKARLWETSLVTYGANPEALLSDVKDFSRSRDLREFEGWLREIHGYSRRDAVAKVSRLNKLLRRDAATPVRDESGEIDSATLLELHKSISKFTVESK